MKRTILTALAAVILASGAAFAKAKPVEGVVNLNTASVEQLMLLPGIGAKKAEAVVAFRKDHPFNASEEITEVKGIGPKMFEKIKPYLAVQGSTTLHEVSPAK